MNKIVISKLARITDLVINNSPFTKIAYGIHGRAHANRVLLFSSLLANMTAEKQPVDFSVITISALLHDCGRENNGNDPYHSKRSADLAVNFIEKHKIDCNKELVKICIERHCIFPDFEEPKIVPIEAKIIGDADKLDRFRFIDQKTPCNPNFLELEESKSLLNISARINGHKWRSFKQ